MRVLSFLHQLYLTVLFLINSDKRGGRESPKEQNNDEIYRTSNPVQTIDGDEVTSEQGVQIDDNQCDDDNLQHSPCYTDETLHDELKRMSQNQDCSDHANVLEHAQSIEETEQQNTRECIKRNEVRKKHIYYDMTRSS